MSLPKPHLGDLRPKWQKRRQLRPRPREPQRGPRWRKWTLARSWIKWQRDTAQKPRKTGNFDLLSPCAASRAQAAKIPCLASSRLDTFLTFRCSFYVRSYFFVNELVGRPYAGIMPWFIFLVARRLLTMRLRGVMRIRGRSESRIGACASATCCLEPHGYDTRLFCGYDRQKLSAGRRARTNATAELIPAQILLLWSPALVIPCVTAEKSISWLAYQLGIRLCCRTNPWWVFSDAEGLLCVGLDFNGPMMEVYNAGSRYSWGPVWPIIMSLGSLRIAPTHARRRWITSVSPRRASDAILHQKWRRSKVREAYEC